ncbi:MAG TPA: hypothetical protein VL332_01695 [Candidatus Saccharimonadaceae bacterium]|jgi:hypothetical protein|nr:hypothetical protein [Candidatus Saccharimonadaceae bacterium]
MRPEKLAAELGISAKHLRSWLRKSYPRPAALVHKPWHLSAAQVAAAREYFKTRHIRAKSREGMTVTTVALTEGMHRRLVAAAVAERTGLTEIVRRAVADWLVKRRVK